MYKSGIIKSPPNVVCYTTVINCCAYSMSDTNERRDALEIFVETYKRVMDDANLQPNDGTFSAILLALQRLVPKGDKRVAIVKNVFKKCTDSGMCNDSVIRRLRPLLQKNELEQLLGADAVSPDGNVRFEMLPLEWKRKVVTDSRSRSSMIRKAASKPLQC